MTTTQPKTRPTAGIALWWLIPPGLRKVLRCRVPQIGLVNGAEALIVGVGPERPTVLLVLNGESDGIRVQLWEVNRKLRIVSDQTVPADGLVGLLQEMVKLVPQT